MNLFPLGPFLDDDFFASTSFRRQMPSPRHPDTIPLPKESPGLLWHQRCTRLFTSSRPPRTSDSESDAGGLGHLSSPYTRQDCTNQW